MDVEHHLSFFLEILHSHQGYLLLSGCSLTNADKWNHGKIKPLLCRYVVHMRKSKAV